MACGCHLFKVAFTRDMVEYRWKYPNPINILDIELAEFDLTSTEYTSEDVEYVAGIHYAYFKPSGVFLVRKTMSDLRGFLPLFVVTRAHFLTKDICQNIFETPAI